MEEVRNKVYNWTLDLIKGGKVLQGLILMFSTWNFAYFRYHIREFKLDDFEKVLNTCGLGYFKDKKFENIDFDNEDIKNKVIKIYDNLSNFDGVGHVGATKVMHFICPNVFVMWDGKIMKNYKLKGSSESYISFMKKMQKMYKNSEFGMLNKHVSIPRAIDLYNMDKYSMPGLIK